VICIIASPKVNTQLEEVWREAVLIQVVVREIQHLQYRERTEPSRQSTQPVHPAVMGTLTVTTCEVEPILIPFPLFFRIYSIFLTYFDVFSCRKTTKRQLIRSVKI